MKTVAPSADFPATETRVLEFWKQNNTFHKSLELRRESKPYKFYDGPPFATGTPHYGHLLAGTIKDIVPRYEAMKGFYVERRFGWDTHGLPIEMLVEQELGLKGSTDIVEFGIDKFNEACRAGVMKYVKEWEHITARLGRWIDFVDDYKTMDLEYMDSVWWVFKQLWDRGRIYEGLRVGPYSWRLTTPLSNFEANSNYKDVQDPAITVRFRLNDTPEISLLAWTTTPWTLPSNMALCVGEKIDYTQIKTDDGEEVILAKARLDAYFPKGKGFEVVKELRGAELLGLTYQPLFDFYADLSEQGAFKVVSDSYVSTDDGTGIVHQSPAHGEDDYRIGTANGLPVVDPVDRDGNFESPVDDFAGKNVKEADREIIRALKDKGLLFKHDTIVHSYPFCERSDTPLIYKAISAWYVKVEDLREQMMANNDTIHWIPEHMKQGRFGKWLAAARDWNISRNRFWGNPLPIWRCEQCDHNECLGSREELEAKIGEKVTDLHKHFVDKHHWACEKCGGQMTRTPEVLDCWFESGSMPYAQLHYPFENKERFEASFPADFVAEGLDQTRGWFYTLMILSTTLFETSPFKNVVVNGMILAEDGKKMSKRLKNYPDPVHIMDNYGSDALRLYLIRSPVVRGESLRFSEEGVRDVVRSVLLPFWNVYSFFTTYANVDSFKPSPDLTNPDNVLDRWIISRFQTLLAGIEREMNEYRLYAVVPNLLSFLEELTNWYVRRSRRRFWSDDEQDKQDGYNTLYFILNGFSKALAPFLPFVTEEIYQNLATLEPGLPESVHLCDYPTVNEELVDEQLEQAMKLVIQTVGLGRSLRASLDLKLRQPLRSITVVTKDESAAEILREHGEHVKQELNVKEVLYSADEQGLVNVEVKPNFPVLGPIFGKQMKQASQELAGLTAEQIEKLESGGKISLLGHEIDITALDVRRSARSEVQIETAGGVTVFFDTELTEDLLSECRAREFVNRVQKMRKEADFQVTDRIRVRFHADKVLGSSLQQNEEYIKAETLSLEFLPEQNKPTEGELIQEHSIEESGVVISVERLNG